ncbi:hypothetical protein [Thiorhodovibrio frisius]|nr:hypothetical protein [Thiorhodovibrio frisius]WPL22259.1 hypothetical protein Thiofri_02419 [Thiorhodovibrio frisius]
MNTPSEPEPDIAVVPGHPRDYRDGHPQTALLVEERLFCVIFETI